MYMLFFICLHIYMFLHYYIYIYSFCVLIVHVVHVFPVVVSFRVVQVFPVVVSFLVVSLVVVVSGVPSAYCIRGPRQGQHDTAQCGGGLSSESKFQGANC